MHISRSNLMLLFALVETDINRFETEYISESRQCPGQPRVCSLLAICCKTWEGVVFQGADVCGVSMMERGNQESMYKPNVCIMASFGYLSPTLEHFHRG